MQLTRMNTAQTNAYTRDQLMAMRARRGALPGNIEIPSNVLNRIQQQVVERVVEQPVARRLNFDNISDTFAEALVSEVDARVESRQRMELPPIFRNQNADINDNEVRFGSLNSEPLEPLEPETPER